MPVVFIEAPPGIRREAKKTLIEKITTAIDDAYHKNIRVEQKQ